jgi:hypothetical protein
MSRLNRWHRKPAVARQDTRELWAIADEYARGHNRPEYIPPGNLARLDEARKRFPAPRLGECSVVMARLHGRWASPGDAVFLTSEGDFCVSDPALDIIGGQLGLVLDVGLGARLSRIAVRLTSG